MSSEGRGLSWESATYESPAEIHSPACGRGLSPEPFVTPCHCGQGKGVPWGDHDWNCPWFITGGKTPTSGRGLSPDEVTTWDCLICGLRWQGTYRDFCPGGHHLSTPASSPS